MIGYRIRNNDSIKRLIKYYLIELEAVEIPKYTKGMNKNPEQYLKIYIYDILKMSLYSQLTLLRNLVYVKDFVLYIKLNHKQDIGNFGRRYNTLNEIARDDRKLISNLYGVDMATALQTILLADMKIVDPKMELPITTLLITDKTRVRKETMQLMGYKTIEIAKMNLTAIFQGRWYNKRYLPLKKLFDERDLISKTLIKQAFTDIKSQRMKYAIERTNTKLAKKFPDNETYQVEEYELNDNDGKQHIRNSFMFYYWTFKEREIQNIIADNFKYPITLHDAVYTQYEQEFNRLNIEDIEKKILKELDIAIKLEVE